MKIAVVQTRPVFGDRPGNLGRALERMETREADLYVLPELFTTGYLFASRDELAGLAEPLQGPTVEALEAFTGPRGCAVYAGFAERDGDKNYNTAVLVSEGNLTASYRKLHLFTDEKALFHKAGGPPVVAEAAGARLGLMICFDWIFPEMARTLTLMNAQVLLNAANLVLPFCQQAMKTRSLENGVFSVLANRVGREDRGGKSLTFTGGSEILDNQGGVLAEASPDREEVITAVIEPSRAYEKMITSTNHLLKDRRVDQYRL